MTFNSSVHALAARHIQDGTGTAIHYWGFATRYLPCTSDPGTCEYLDAVYGNHEKSMIRHVGSLWDYIARNGLRTAVKTE
jgi:hypothetical protein